jgi:hypothetical protein
MATDSVISSLVGELNGVVGTIQLTDLVHGIAGGVGQCQGQFTGSRMRKEVAEDE